MNKYEIQVDNETIIVDKLSYEYSQLDGDKKLVKKTSCQLNYFDLEANARVTKDMYIVSDKIEVDLINNEFVAHPFQIRFIQMDVDNL